MKKLQQNLTQFLTITMLGIIFVICGSQKLYATHAAGSDIKYRCLGGLQYEVEVTFYRDCGGVAEPANITINYSSATANKNLTATANKIAVTGQEITVPCASSSSTCNGGTTTGIRQFVYRATITLPSARADWVFSYSVCCRNCSITTINSPCASNSTLYVEAKLNNLLASCNSSPTFSNIPIAFVCLGQNFNYNHGVIDPDGDSLAYQLITPKTTATTNVSYIAPASATTPVASSTPFTMNAVTGDLNFTPSQIQIGIMAILVKEYRNGQLIGSVIRDMQVYTTACSNNLPTATGINGTNNFSLNICPNQQFCFTVNTADADASQTVTITTNSGIPNATYTISGGSRPTLTFCWTPTTADISPNPRTFTLTVRDNACPNNGIQTYSYTLFVPDPYFSTSGTNVTCNGGTNGTASATPLNASLYTYSWNTTPIRTTQNINNLSAGSYTVTATNSGGCTLQQTVTITEPPAIVLTTNNTNSSCTGLCNGIIDLSVTGGTAPYTYSWSNGQTTQDINNLCQGTYSVTVTDANNCTKTSSVTLTNSFTLTSNAIATSVSCFGGNTGSISTTISGGTTPYIYAWSNGATTQNLANAIAGNYTVTITDNTGCTSTSSAQVTQPSAALSASITKTNVLCFGNSTGAATSTVSGGTVPYSYAWSNGATTSSISNIPSGNYTLTVTDNRGCTILATTTITQPLAALSITPGQTNVLCFGNTTGNASVIITGGTSGYTYNWSNGSTASLINNLSAGNYSVTVTDANSCSTNRTFTITQPSAALTGNASAAVVSCYGGNNGSVILSNSGGTSPYSYLWSNGSTTQNLPTVVAGVYTVTITDINNCTFSTQATVTQPAAPLSVVAAKTNVLCYGNNTGDITLTVNGGTSTYSYLWNNGATTQNISSLTSGSYSVTVMDVRGCTSTANATINQPAAALNLTTTKTNVRCFGDATGAINTSVSGGTSPYVYLWNTGATTANISNLISGNYTVTVTDANNCSSVATISILQPNAALSSVTSSVNVKCYSNNTGSATTTISGGTTPYTYLWNNGTGTASNTNLIAGTYTVTVTDFNGCTLSNTFNITQPSAPLQTSLVGSNVLCYGLSTGSIDLTVNGGTTPYNYSWSNSTSSQDPSNLSSGTYTVTVTDDNNCTSTNSIIISQPLASLSAVISGTDINCHNGNDGTAAVATSGGTTPYSYLWNNNATTSTIANLTTGTYSVTITDANNCSINKIITLNEPSASLSLSSTPVNVTCNGLPVGSVDLSVSGGTTPYTYLWNNGAQQQDITNLSAGTYSVTVTDNNGCTETLSAVVSQPAGALNATGAITNVSCFGESNGSIDLTATAGTPPYSYSWSNGSTNQDLSNLNAGPYTVTVTDNNACAIIFTLFVIQPSGPLSTAFATTDVLCYGNSTGAIDLTISGGTSPYNTIWSNNSTTEDLSGLPSGNYTVNVTDAQGCTTSGNANILQPTSPLTLSSTVTNLNCHDVQDGAINITVSGGTAPYIYQWNDGITTEDLLNLSTGNYTVTVTDANNCSITNSFSIIYTAATLTANAAITQVLCHGNSTGAINLNIQGGTSPFSYVWSNNESTEDLTNIPVGIYSATITDVNGCTTNYSGTVNEPVAAITISNTITPVLCFGNNTGAIDLTTQGGTYPYTYNWSNGATTEDLAGISANTYTVTITDANNCILNDSFNVLEPAAGLQAVFQLTDPACNGDQTGSISTILSGGTPNYTITWNNQPSSADLNNIGVGTYTLEVIDANGCVLTQTATLQEPSAALSVQTQLTMVDCNGNNTGAINLQPTGGTSPYTFNWSNGAQTQSINSLAAGNYQYTVTDAHLCTYTSSEEIQQPANALSATSALTNVNCYNESTGGIDLTISGGTAPYNFLWNNSATTEDLSNLGYGDYTVTVTDANNCSITQTYTITQPAAPLSLQHIISNVSCFGGNNGTIQTTVSGGTTSYTYSWNNGESQSDISSLIAGTYSILVTDAAGCSITENFTVSQPLASLSLTSNITPVSCNGNNNGSISLTVNGGTSPYNYNWSNGATTATINSLLSGTYTVTITDANSCTIENTMAVQQPAAALDITYIVTDVKCFGNATGGVSAQINGGTSPYSYNWSTGSTSSSINSQIAGTYTLTVSDANGCSHSLPVSISQPVAAIQTVMTPHDINCNSENTGWIELTVSGGMGNYTYQWNNGGTNEDPTNLAAGSYSVIVSDQNGCTASATTSINQPASGLTINSNTSNVSCHGGENGDIKLIVNGGTPGYNYLWSNGTVDPQLTGIGPGNYTVTVTDSNGCSEIYSTSVSEPGEGLSATSSINASYCLSNIKGNIYIQVQGGTSPYSYLWNDGVATQDRLNESPGIYTVNITDFNGCELSRTIILNDSSTLTIAAHGETTICTGDKATLFADVVQGATLQWNYNGIALNGATSSTFITPVAGTYTLVATTSCGSYTSNPVEISLRTMNNVSVNNNVIICKGESVQLQAGGGIEYTWQPTDGLNFSNIPNPIAKPNKTTDYTVTVKDDYGCRATANVTVTIACDTLDIPNGFSPNDDGVNDYFVIDGINMYPGNSIFIYNRWGNLIYKQKEYDNKWNGRSNVGGVMFGEDLPNGTYFFILDLNINEKPINGFVVIRR